jgi:hypothetical protein
MDIIWLLLCTVPLVFLGGLYLLIVLMNRRTKKAAPAELSPPAILQAFEERVRLWISQGRLSDADAAPILALIQADLRLAPSGGFVPVTATPPAAAPVSTAPTVPPAHEQPAAPAAEPAPQRVAWREQIGAALLTLRTRRTLLYMGAFLLVVSALVLVLFSWASFSPLAQFGLLASVCAGLWGGGAWLGRQPGLQMAGRNLQAVASLLLPLTGFALARPGLLDLELRSAWLLASLISLAAYLTATWRLRRRFYAVAAAAATLSALLAALRPLDDQWLLPVANGLLAAYVPLAWWLRRRRLAEFAAGPYWVAQAGLPPLLLLALLERWGWMPEMPVVAVSLWSGAMAYAGLTFTERRPAYVWVAAILAPLALLSTLDSFYIAYTGAMFSLSLLALAYLLIGVALEPQGKWYALPFYGGLALLSLVVTIAALFNGSNMARLALPPLLLLGGLIIWLRERGTFALFGERIATTGAVLGLLAIGGNLPIWLLHMLDLTPLDSHWYAILLMLPALPVFAAASWWPGRLRTAYAITLQANGVIILLFTGTIAWFLPEVQPWAALLAAGLWIFQAVLRRHELWAAAALGALLLAGVRALDPQTLPLFNAPAWLALLLMAAGLFAVGGTLLRHRSWRYWTVPALGWAAICSVLVLAQIVSAWSDSGQFIAAQSAAVLVLAALAAALGAAWCRPPAGYPAAALFATGVMIAATRDFFLPWPIATHYYGLLLSAIALGYGLLGQWLRRRDRAYAFPYEWIAAGLLLLAPLPAFGNARATCLTFLAFGGLFALATWRYRRAWLALPAFAALDMVLLSGAAWRFPGGDPIGAAYLLLGAAWFQGLFALVARRGAATLLRQTALPAYLTAALSSVGALLIAEVNLLGVGDQYLPAALIGLGIALLAALIAIWEQQEGLAWGALLPAAYAVARLFAFYDLALEWALAWGGLVALGFSLAGWLLSFAGAAGRIWRRPLIFGPLAAALLLVASLVPLCLATEQLPPLTFGLANLGLLLATLAVRERRFAYVYGTGAALLSAALCQLADWGFREPQWYVLPAGLYLLALAEGIRRFQGRQQVARIVDAGALLLLLGTTLGQALRNSDFTSTLYTLLLCGESLLLVAYGTVRKLRVPFFGGIGFFVIGVLWLSIDPLRSANQWLLIGGVGLLLVAAYVLLERRQEQLVRSGRLLLEQIRGWQ